MSLLLLLGGGSSGAVVPATPVGRLEDGLSATGPEGQGATTVTAIVE